jgi:hypothetical protein
MTIAATDRADHGGSGQVEGIVGLAEAGVAFEIGNDFGALAGEYGAEGSDVFAHGMQAEKAQQGAGVLFGHGDDALWQFDQGGALVRVKLGNEAFLGFIKQIQGSAPAVCDPLGTFNDEAMDGVPATVVAD